LQAFKYIYVKEKIKHNAQSQAVGQNVFSTLLSKFSWSRLRLVSKRRKVVGTWEDTERLVAEASLVPWYE